MGWNIGASQDGGWNIGASQTDAAAATGAMAATGAGATVGVAVLTAFGAMVATAALATVGVANLTGLAVGGMSATGAGSTVGVAAMGSFGSLSAVGAGATVGVASLVDGDNMVAAGAGATVGVADLTDGAAPILGAVYPVHSSAIFQMSGVGAGGVALKKSVAVSRAGPVVFITPPRFTWAVEASSWTWVAQVTAGNRTIPIEATGMTRLQVREGVSVTLRGRPTAEDESVVYASAVETILLKVFNTTRINRTTPVYTEELPVESVMYETLQNDRGWKQGAVGYSVKYALPAGILIEGGRRYQVEMILRTKADGPCPVVWEIQTSSLLTSRAELGV